jgi:hypothetical protein
MPSTKTVLQADPIIAALAAADIMLKTVKDCDSISTLTRAELILEILEFIETLGEMVKTILDTLEQLQEIIRTECKIQ